MEKNTIRDIVVTDKMGKKMKNPFSDVKFVMLPIFKKILFSKLQT